MIFYLNRKSILYNMSDEWPIIPREHYLSLIWKQIDALFIKVIAGIHRCGKTSIVDEFCKRLISAGVSHDDIIFIKTDDRNDISCVESLTSRIESLTECCSGKYAILDGIDEIYNWEKSAILLFEKGFDVFVTVPNRRISSELSERSVIIDILPLTFSEYSRFRSNCSNEVILNDYIKSGGLPAVAVLQDMCEKILIPNLISDSFYTIYAKELVDQYNIRDTKSIMGLVKYIMKNIGERISPRKAAEFITDSGNKVSHVTVEKYIRHLEDSMLIFRVRHFNPVTGKYVATSDKLYATDLGIRNLIVPFRPEDIDGILENVVYNELRYRFEEVAVCDVNGTEIDFVVNYSSKPEYFQVCYSLNSQDVVEREIRLFRVIEDSYPKTVITYERYILDDIDGVRVVSILDWLTENNDS